VTVVAGFGSAAAGIVRRDVAIFLSYRTRFVTQLAASFFSLFVLYYVSRLVGARAFRTPDEYFAFAVVGVAVMQVLAATLSTLPTSVRQELVAGTFERFVLSSYGPVASVASTTFFPFAMAFVDGALTLVVAVAVFGLRLEWPDALLAVPVVTLGALAFIPFALALAAAVVSFKQAVGGAGFVVTGITLIGGFLYPVSVLPSWIRWTSEVQPFTPTLVLLRHLLVGAPDAADPWVTAAKVAAFAVVLLPVSLMLLRMSIRVAQRRGTITEY
jgi:ABC-2 type transport system permease protein